MPNSKLFTTSYDRFKRVSTLTRRVTAKKALARFAYRYRLAESFEGMYAPKVGKTLLGYDAITKVFLSYTAYEALICPALKLRIQRVAPIMVNVILNSDIDEKLRSNTKLISYLAKYTTDSKLKHKIKLTANATLDDIACVAYGIRNVFAHGELTASAIGLSRKEQRDSMLDLADAILDYCDELFTDCVEKLR